jgi:hypothetical protein
MPEERPATAFSDVADVVSVKTDDQLPMVVGGHAVNIWALAYSSRLGLQLQSYAPFTTKDLDLWGPKKILDSLAQKYGVEITLSPPRSPGIGYVVIPRGNLQLKVELLTGVRGIRQIEEQNGVQLTILGTKVRVLDAISCLKAKIVNAADIDQSDRQDIKHIKIMKLCAREFAIDMIDQANQGKISERLAVHYLEDLRETIASPKAESVTRKWHIRFEDVMPVEAIRQSTMEKVRNFARFRLKPSETPRSKIDFSPQQRPDGPKMSL